MIKIILVEDHLVVRNGIKLLLDTQEDVQVIAEAKDGNEALAFLERGLMPDVLITDISMPEMDGTDLTEVLCKDYPGIKVIILSMLSDPSDVASMFAKGAKAYMLKNVSYEELLFGIHHVYKGGRFLCEELAMQLLNLVNSDGFLGFGNETIIKSPIDLSEREYEVLQLISDGYTNLEIADKLFISKRTVEGHRQNLIEKTDVKNSASLIKYAVLNRLVQ